MTGKAFVARVVPTSHRILLHGQHYFQGMREVICRFIEQAMTQSGTNEYAEKTVIHQWVELFLRYTLLTEQLMLQQIDRKQTDCPAQ